MNNLFSGSFFMRGPTPVFWGFSSKPFQMNCTQYGSHNLALGGAMEVFDSTPINSLHYE